MNKIDLPQAQPDEVAAEVAELVGDDAGARAAPLGEDGRRRRRTCSTPSSSGSRPRPATPTRPRRALIFDSSYDQYRGVVAFVRVVDGVVPPRRAA